MKKTTAIIAMTAAVLLSATAAVAQNQPDGGDLVWNSDLQPFYKCMNEDGWAWYGSGDDRYAECFSYPNSRGDIWKVVSKVEMFGGFHESNKSIMLDIQAPIHDGLYRTVMKKRKVVWQYGWMDKYECKGELFGNEPRARSRDCFNQLMQHTNNFGKPHPRKTIFALTGPRFNSVERVWKAEGWDIAGSAHAQLGMTANQDADDCRALCIKDKACKAFTYAPGVCFLKPGGNSATYSPTVTAGRKW